MPSGHIRVLPTSAPRGRTFVLGAGKASADMAAKHIYSYANAARPEDRVIFLISGGGAALLTLPADGIELHEKQKIISHLLKSGVPVEDTNLVRRHLSKSKGGRLAAAASPGELYTYVLSGELTVRVINNNGRGGPNLEYLAALSLALDGATGIEALACDSPTLTNVNDIRIVLVDGAERPATSVQ
jgi:glycerate-2-kinase